MLKRRRRECLPAAEHEIPAHRMKIQRIKSYAGLEH